MILRDSSYVDPLPAPWGWREFTASLLQGAGRLLDRLAARVAAPPVEANYDPLLEFYAEAGAPEGVLYLDGQRIGTVPGVNRL